LTPAATRGAVHFAPAATPGGPQTPNTHAMKRLTSLLLTLLCLVTLAPAAQAVAVPIPPPPSLQARAWILIDQHSGRVLVAQNADERLEPASLTKLMTAYAVFHSLKEGKLKLSDEVPISEHAWRAEGSRTFVDVGTRVPVETLLQGMIIQSATTRASPSPRPWPARSPRSRS